MVKWPEGSVHQSKILIGSDLPHSQLSASSTHTAHSLLRPCRLRLPYQHCLICINPSTLNQASSLSSSLYLSPILHSFLALLLPSICSQIWAGVQGQNQQIGGSMTPNQFSADQPNDNFTSSPCISTPYSGLRLFTQTVSARDVLFQLHSSRFLYTFSLFYRCYGQKGQSANYGSK